MIFRNKNRMTEYWKKLMDSTHRKMALGAERISRCIAWPHKDAWRRKDTVQRGHNRKKQ